MRIAALVLVLGFLAGCNENSSDSSDASTAASSNQPAPAMIAGGRPIGLYFMTKYWIATRSLEKSVWYFAPDGTAYDRIETGFTEKDLAEHKGGKGKLSVNGENLVLAWSDGTKTEAKFERDKGSDGFAWNTGLYSPVKPFKNPNDIVGKYEGGESISFSGNYAAVSKSLELRADGTFTMTGVSSFQTTSNDSTVNTGGTSGLNGKWKLEGYSLTLTDDKGNEKRSICFPFDDEKTPIYPDRTFISGTMMKKQQ